MIVSRREQSWTGSRSGHAPSENGEVAIIIGSSRKCFHGHAVSPHRFFYRFNNEFTSRTQWMEDLAGFPGSDCSDYSVHAGHEPPRVPGTAVDFLNPMRKWFHPPRGQLIRSVCLGGCGEWNLLESTAVRIQIGVLQCYSLPRMSNYSSGCTAR